MTKLQFTELLQAKDVKLKELAASSERLGLAKEEIEGRFKQLMGDVEALRREKTQFSQALEAALMVTEAVGEYSQEAFRFESRTSPELLLLVQREFEYLRSAKTVAEHEQQHFAGQYYQTRAALSNLEAEKQFLERRHELELRFLRHQNNALHIPQQPQIRASAGNFSEVALANFQNSAMDLVYDEDVEEALEQVSRLKQRFEALRIRKRDITMISSVAPERRSLCLRNAEAGSTTTTEAQSSSHARDAVSPMSALSSGFYLSDNTTDWRDSMTSGSIHETSENEHQNRECSAKSSSVCDLSPSHDRLQEQQEHADLPAGEDEHHTDDQQEMGVEQKNEDYHQKEDQLKSEGQENSAGGQMIDEHREKNEHPFHEAQREDENQQDDDYQQQNEGKPQPASRGGDEHHTEVEDYTVAAHANAGAADSNQCSDHIDSSPVDFTLVNEDRRKDSAANINIANDDASVI